MLEWRVTPAKLGALGAPCPPGFARNPSNPTGPCFKLPGPIPTPAEPGPIDIGPIPGPPEQRSPGAFIEPTAPPIEQFPGPISTPSVPGGGPEPTCPEGFAMHPVTKRCIDKELLRRGTSTTPSAVATKSSAAPVLIVGGFIVAGLVWAVLT